MTEFAGGYAVRMAGGCCGGEQATDDQQGSKLSPEPADIREQRKPQQTAVPPAFLAGGCHYSPQPSLNLNGNRHLSA